MSIEIVGRIPNMIHATKYYQDFWAFEDLEPTEAEKIDPSAPPEQNEAAIDTAIDRLLKQLQRLEAVKATMETPGWSFIEQKALRTIRKMEQDLIWAAIKKGDANDVQQISSEHDGILAFFNLVDPLKVRISEVKQEIELKLKSKEIYVEGKDPLTVIEKEQ